MSVTKLVAAEELFELSSATDYELIEGELREVSPSFGHSSQIAALFVATIHPFVRAHKLGYVTSEAGGYILSRNPDTVLAPDCGFIRKSLLPSGLPTNEYIPFPPDLAVEVMSISDRKRDLDRKAHRYLDSGTRMVWLVQPASRSVTIYRQNLEPIEIRENGMLEGFDVLPGFSMPVADVFHDPLD